MALHTQVDYWLQWALTRLYWLLEPHYLSVLHSAVCTGYSCHSRVPEPSTEGSPLPGRGKAGLGMLTPKDMLWSQPRGQHLSSHWIVQTHGRILLQCISPVRGEPDDQEAVAKFQCAFKIKVCVEGITVQVWVHMCANGAHACVYMSLWRSLLQLPLTCYTEAASLSEPGAHPSI